MRTPLAIILVAALPAFTGCTMDGGPSSASAKGGATATLADAGGAARGSASFTATSGGVRVVYDGVGLPPGVHGIHVHTTGRCDAPDFTTAGGHWNPAMKLHGMEAANGPHEGDLPNLTVAADGSVHYEGLLKKAMLTGDTSLLDADGAALIVHAAADDYRTDPSGNSGARIACGVVTAG